ncbi:sterol desaturase family protein [Phenylobacterium aquaticum]|uniref:sterol desaturase family protein n=1 Tax=Phenylobacterium aquaticum TaxID=1763816 RepID=UPI001F5E19DA|nr:sterol desaturase family protein [Phenylobacterium aquaticum]MCI3132821.1 sterol desaturase family protein [Phenylobacterium aquaticum]
MPLSSTLTTYGQHWLSNLSYDLSRYAMFAIAVWFVIWVLLRGPMAGRKLREATPGARQLVTEFAVSMRTVAIFSTVGLLTFSLERAGFLPGPQIAARLGWGWAVASLVLMILGHDAYFYWTHRLVHHRRLFRTFHRRHHRSNNPSPFSAYSFDLAEAALQAAFAPLWLLIVPTAWPVVGLFMLHQIARNTLGHCGYEVFPSTANARPLLGFMTTTTHHDLHHAQAGWNYGLYFTWWDRWMGTEHPDYLARFAAASGRRLPAVEAPQ